MDQRAYGSDLLEEGSLLRAGPSVVGAPHRDGVAVPTVRLDALQDAVHNGLPYLLAAVLAGQGHLDGRQAALGIHHADLLSAEPVLPLAQRRYAGQARVPEVGNDGVGSADVAGVEVEIPVQHAEVRCVRAVRVRGEADEGVLLAQMVLWDGGDEEVLATQLAQQFERSRHQLQVPVGPLRHAVLHGDALRRLQEGGVRRPVGRVRAPPRGHVELHRHGCAADRQRSGIAAGPGAGGHVYRQPDRQQRGPGRRLVVEAVVVGEVGEQLADAERVGVRVLRLHSALELLDARVADGAIGCRDGASVGRDKVGDGRPQRVKALTPGHDLAGAAAVARPDQSDGRYRQHRPQVLLRPDLQHGVGIPEPHRRPRRRTDEGQREQREQHAHMTHHCPKRAWHWGLLPGEVGDAAAKVCGEGPRVKQPWESTAAHVTRAGGPARSMRECHHDIPFGGPARGQRPPRARRHQKPPGDEKDWG